MRSFLFVPADSERKLARGSSFGADGLILDLEDSVAADRKKTARDMALAYLRSASRAGPKLYVRVNALDTGLTLGDLAVVMQGRPDGIVFPKCVGQANLDLLAHYLDAFETREGIDAGATRILTIATESAAAVLALTAAPAKHARLMGHSWGGEDLMADLGASSLPSRTTRAPACSRSTARCSTVHTSCWRAACSRARTDERTRRAAADARSAVRGPARFCSDNQGVPGRAGDSLLR